MQSDNHSQSEVLVKVTNLVKHYGHIKAVDGISFEVRRGDILGFLGPNGAGKSTAMKMITCFLDPTAGDISVCGHDVAAQPLAVRQELGYLPESAPAYGDMTVASFLDFVCDARSIVDRGPAIDRVVEMTGLQRVFHQSIETLSKGFKRRVGLAQALIHDPQVLILDEPTDGLDPNQKGMIQDMITKIAADKCVILSTHILDEVERVCNRALIISEGKILVDSTPEDLMHQAPNHNLIEVHLSQPNNALVDKIAAMSWCQDLKRQNDRRFLVTPVDGKNHLTDMLEVLDGAELERVSLHEGRLEDLFRKITGGVCA